MSLQRERHLEEALRDVMGLIERNVLVRNPGGDHSPDWLKRATELVMTLKRAQALLEPEGK